MIFKEQNNTECYTVKNEGPLDFWEWLLPTLTCTPVRICHSCMCVCVCVCVCERERERDREREGEREAGREREPTFLFVKTQTRAHQTHRPVPCFPCQLQRSAPGPLSPLSRTLQQDREWPGASCVHGAQTAPQDICVPPPPSTHAVRLPTPEGSSRVKVTAGDTFLAAKQVKRM